VPNTDLAEPVPAELKTEQFVLRPITADDAEMDHAAVMDTREHLRSWDQSTWPEDDFTVEANRQDLIDLEERHAAHRAFTYAVLDPDRTRSLGCVYVFPTSATFLVKSTVVPVDGENWTDVQAVVFFWVRPSQMELGVDARLLFAVREWFKDEWRLEKTVYVTSEQFTQQRDVMERTDLRLKFELLEPGKPRKYLVFG
jgi:RimJ/RimL family protein N-acetyltransferase